MKAMILAAGLGTRLRPLTLERPKPLIQVGGKSLIEYQIENLVRSGITQIVINHAWLGQQIEDALGNGSQFGASISYSAESDPLETAGGIRQALDKLVSEGDEPFLVVNGDLFINCNYADLELSLPATMLAKLWLVDNPDWHPEGDFALTTDARVDVNGSARLTFSGISLLRPSLFVSLKAGEKAALAPILRDAMSSGRVVGEKLPGYWNDVGTHERLAQVEALLSKRESN